MTEGNARSRKHVRTQLAARYLTALRAHLGKKTPGNGNRAQSLGRAAVAGGLVTLDLANIHTQAVDALAAAHNFDNLRNGSLKRAGQFFTAAIFPLELDQRATRKTNRQLQQCNETLRGHTAALARGTRRLEREITRRKSGELAVRKGKEQYRKLFVESQAMQVKLRELTRQIIAAQEEERKRISHELHDEVVQTLIGINVGLSALHRGGAVGLPGLKSKITRAQRLVEESVRAVHRFARELRPAVLDDLGLIPALHAYCKNLAKQQQLKIQMTVFGGVEALGGAKRTVFFRVAEEALTNVARHARATRVKLVIRAIPGGIRMEICDNGKSFHVKNNLLSKKPKRLGLLSMKERLEMVGGTLTIESTPGKGTTLRAEIPFADKH